jgi:anti-sigma factor RsiW
MSLPSPQSDLSLTALRYLAGELDGSDLSAFEQRLATDDAAQRALIEAVQISAAIQTGAPAPTVRPATRVAATRQPQRTSRWSGAAALLCCALAVATVLIALQGEPQLEVPVASSEETSSGATVSLWTELNVDDIAASLEESSLYESDGESAEGVNVPDWMFAAIETDFEANNPATDPGAEAPL